MTGADPPPPLPGRPAFMPVALGAAANGAPVWPAPEPAAAAPHLPPLDFSALRSPPPPDGGAAPLGSPGHGGPVTASRIHLGLNSGVDPDLTSGSPSWSAAEHYRRLSGLGGGRGGEGAPGERPPASAAPTDGPALDGSSSHRPIAWSADPSRVRLDLGPGGLTPLKLETVLRLAAAPDEANVASTSYEGPVAGGGGNRVDASGDGLVPRSDPLKPASKTFVWQVRYRIGGVPDARIKFVKLARDCRGGHRQGNYTYSLPAASILDHAQNLLASILLPPPLLCAPQAAARILKMDRGSPSAPERPRGAEVREEYGARVFPILTRRHSDVVVGPVSAAAFGPITGGSCRGGGHTRPATHR